jgi:hypothetical protein
MPREKIYHEYCKHCDRNFRLDGLSLAAAKKRHNATSAHKNNVSTMRRQHIAPHVNWRAKKH